MPSSAWEPVLLLALYLLLDLAAALLVQVPATRACSHASRARRAAAAARADAKAAASPATFAASAKHERRALAFEREAERAEAEAAGVRAHPHLKRAAMVKTVAGLALALRWWGAPVLRLGPAASPWPVTWWLSQPHGRAAWGKAGGSAALARGLAGVAPLPWSALCSRASAAVARAVVAAVASRE